MRAHRAREVVRKLVAKSPFLAPIALSSVWHVRLIRSGAFALRSATTTPRLPSRPCNTTRQNDRDKVSCMRGITAVTVTSLAGWLHLRHFSVERLIFRIRAPFFGQPLAVFRSVISTVFPLGQRRVAAVLTQVGDEARVSSVVTPAVWGIEITAPLLESVRVGRRNMTQRTDTD